MVAHPNGPFGCRWPRAKAGQGWRQDVVTMKKSGSFDGSRERVNRRAILKHLAGAAVTGAFVSRAHAEDAALDALMNDNNGQFGQNFDQGSRTIAMPKATAPTLSPSTAQITEQAIKTYDGIVARGGWPTVPQTGDLHVGARDPSIVQIRQRLAASGDLDPTAVAADNDVYDSYVEEAVRRFQARHGLTIDGVVRATTLAAMNIPAAT